MDLRAKTSLLCAALALAIAVSILLRGRGRRQQLLFFAFALDIGLWYLAQWLYHFVRADVWYRFTAILAVVLPQLGVHLFDAIVPAEGKRSTLLLRVAGVLVIPAGIIVLSPLHRSGLARGAVFLYVFGLLAAGLVLLARRGERSRSRATQRRVRFLVIMGSLAALFSLADFLWFIGAPLPPVGAVLAIVFLFVLAESMTRERLVDLYELLGQLVVSTALAFSLAGIFYLFVETIGGFDTIYLNAVMAAIVILVLFEPMREKVEGYIHGVFFRERVDLEKAVTDARRDLIHVLEVGQMLQVVVSALERSRRATGAAIYLRDPLGNDFELGLAFGPPAPKRVEGATARPVLERLEQGTTVAFERIAEEVEELRRRGEARSAADEQLLAAAELLGAFRTGVCVGIRSEGRELLGVLVVVDDRIVDAFSPEEIGLLESLAIQMGVVIENSRQYRRMQERDRLAALGQMAAGLAHEVRNPLGAIKGAAQLLADPAPRGHDLDPAAREFVDIIVEEVDRLDRVVSSVLDYARPAKGNPHAVDVNGVVLRTLQVLAASPEHSAEVETDLFEDLPPVRVDSEQLRQTLMNLVKNATQAGSRRIRVATRPRRARSPTWGADDAALDVEWVEVVVEDDGPGIAPHIFESLFVPFFTTKPRGTGLGLAISQRVIQEAGGRIEVNSTPGSGAVFTIVLPVVGRATALPGGRDRERGASTPMPGSGSLERPVA